MKSRSQQRLPITSDPPDDWGDGSWTVDCSCGVTFDDGEEMVNCDECGVWVHTRCSRFEKGNKSFVCDKCKNKNTRHDHNKETEVAQLLVELPTKTVRMEARPTAALPPLGPPLKPHVSMEERVHVQGIPGGDPALFQGLSRVFSRELWKCTGYVPKKFNFQYKEFPCWEKKYTKGREYTKVEESENLVDRGADVLLSFSKEVVPCTNLAGESADYGASGELDGWGKKLCPEEMARRDMGRVNLNSGNLRSSTERDMKQKPAAGILLGKRKKEDQVFSKERTMKKTKVTDKELKSRKRGTSTASDTPKLDFNERGEFKVGNSTDCYDANDRTRKETLHDEHSYETHNEAAFNDPEVDPKLSMKAPKVSNEAFCISSHVIEVQKTDELVPIKNEDTSRAKTSGISTMELKGVVQFSVKEEDVSTDFGGANHLKDESHNMEDLNGDSSVIALDRKKSKHVDEVRKSFELSKQERHNLIDSRGPVSITFQQVNANKKTEEEDDQAKGYPEFVPAVDDKHFNLLQPERHNSENDDKVLEAVSFPHAIKEEITPSCKFHKIEPESIASLTLQEGDSTSKQSPKYIEESSKFGSKNPSPDVPTLRKLVVGIENSSASSALVFSKASISGSCELAGAPVSSASAIKPSHSSKKRVKVKSLADQKKENVINNVPRDGIKQEVPTAVKDCPKSPENYVMKPSNASRSSHHSIRRPSSSDSKEQVPCLFSSSAQNAASFSGAAENSSSPQTQNDSQEKLSSSVTHQKSEKLNQASKTAFYSSSLHAPAPVNASTILSDEELALLLHQELNSSPRVPRVPRVRHAASLPHLSSPTVTSMLAKRASNSGGKEHMVSRRRNREEACKDNSRHSRELSDENQRADIVSSSLDHGQSDAFACDGMIKRESFNRSPHVRAASKKIVSHASSTHSNIGLSYSVEANDQTLSSIRSTPSDTADDGVGGVPGSLRTLPGLIDDILSKGKRMTCEELCDAVLPHWQNLRKHNGERYAYSSHSQAVLDCLRNRNEWAQLIDRGPKTNSSRKRHKPDAETSAFELEKEDGKSGAKKKLEGENAESHQEDFPRGKRNVRKWRQLQLQGQVLKEVRKRRKADANTDDDFGNDTSDEGTESSFSDDENIGGRTRETSFSSDET